MKTFKIIFFIFLFYSTLSSVSIMLLNDKIEMISTGVCRILVKIDENEVIYKDHILFSVNHPNIYISKYNINIEPEDLYIPSFRQNKKVYSKHFNVDLVLKGIDKNINHGLDLVFQFLIFNLDKEKSFADYLILTLISANKSICLEDKKLDNKKNCMHISLIKQKHMNFLYAKSLFIKNIGLNNYIKLLYDKIVKIFKSVTLFSFFGNTLFLFLSFCFFLFSCYFLAKHEKRSLTLGFLFGFFSLPMIIKFLILNCF